MSELTIDCPLKPCPFCGRQPTLDDTDSPNCYGHGLALGCCVNFETPLPRVIRGGYTKEEIAEERDRYAKDLIKMWNTRYLPSEYPDDR